MESSATPPGGVAPSTQQGTDPVQLGVIITIVGAAVGGIGCLGPWATLGIFSKGGMEGDGTLLLGLLIVAAILAAIWFSFKAHGLMIAAAAMAGLATLVALLNVADVSSTSTEAFGAQIKPSIGWGLWLAFLGSAAATFGAVFSVVKTPSKAPVAKEGEILVSTLRSLSPPAEPSEGWKEDPVDASRMRWWTGSEWEAKIMVRRSNQSGS